MAYRRPLTEAQLREALQAFEDHGRNMCAAAKSLKMQPKALEYRVTRAQNLGITLDKEEYSRPQLPSGDIPTDQLIDHLEKRFEKKKAAQDARDWMQFRVNLDGPYGLAFVGDPHLGADCNISLLKRDLEILEKTEALWGVGLGDYTNNWSGKLMRKWADEETTRKQTWQLAEWLFGRKKKSGQSIWFVLIKGNHDLWSGSSDPLDWMERGGAALEDWEARFKVVSGKSEARIWCRHDFPGRSQWHDLHGPLKAAKYSGAADVYICGDKHCWGYFEGEDPNRPGNIMYLARARGYKWFDSYAMRLGYQNEKYGATITAIVDPQAEGPTRIRLFSELEEAAEFLKFKRRRRG